MEKIIWNGSNGGYPSLEIEKISQNHETLNSKSQKWWKIIKHGYFILSTRNCRQRVMIVVSHPSGVSWSLARVVIATSWLLAPLRSRYHFMIVGVPDIWCTRWRFWIILIPCGPLEIYLESHKWKKNILPYQIRCSNLNGDINFFEKTSFSQSWPSKSKITNLQIEGQNHTYYFTTLKSMFWI